MKTKKVTQIIMTESEFLEAIEEVGLDFLTDVDLNIVPIVVVPD